MTDVTLVTSKSRAKSPQTDADWKDLFDDLKNGLSIGDFQRKYGIGLSRAAWNKYERGIMALSDDMKTELRRAVGLPITVAEATAAASPDAAVWQVGDGVPDVVIMVAAQEPVTLYVNGSVSVGNVNATMPCLPVLRRELTGQRQRKRYARPTASQEQEQRRLALGAKWTEIIELGLSALEKETQSNG